MGYREERGYVRSRTFAARAELALNRTALLATVHCLTGCAIGEVLGMIIGTALGWGNPATIALSVVLAFAFGYSLTMIPLLRVGAGAAAALPLAFAVGQLSRSPSWNSWTTASC